MRSEVACATKIDLRREAGPWANLAAKECITNSADERRLAMHRTADRPVLIEYQRHYGPDPLVVGCRKQVRDCVGRQREDRMREAARNIHHQAVLG